MKTEVLFPDPYPDTDPDFRKDIYELQQFLIDEVPLSYEVEIIKHPKLKSCIKVTNDQGRERFVKPSRNHVRLLIGFFAMHAMKMQVG